jgi:hypothetical protein
VSWLCYVILFIALVLWLMLWQLRKWLKKMKAWVDQILKYIQDECRCSGPHPGDPPPPPGGWPT